MPIRLAAAYYVASRIIEAGAFIFVLKFNAGFQRRSCYYNFETGAGTERSKRLISHCAVFIIQIGCNVVRIIRRTACHGDNIGRFHLLHKHGARFDQLVCRLFGNLLNALVQCEYNAGFRISRTSFERKAYAGQSPPDAVDGKDGAVPGLVGKQVIVKQRFDTTYAVAVRIYITD